MPRYYVSWKSTCTWSTDVEGDSEEDVRELVKSKDWPQDTSNIELITEDDVKDYLVVELIEEENA